MKTHSTRARLLASSMICGVAALAIGGQAMAQDADESTVVEDLVVTGSRIPQPNLTSVSPVTAVSNETIKLEGTTRVEDLLNALPQAFASQGSEVSNGSTGTASVDLRGLGSQRTLVLIDGRRIVPGDPIFPVTDLNFIPASLVDRVDVVTGGASAVYGADAVAGVVNFIMMKNFEGVRLEAQISGYQHHNDSDIGSIVRARGFTTPPDNVWDGGGIDLTGVVGINSPDGRGNATVYATYRKVDAITQDMRDYSSCALQEEDDAPGNFLCGGSGTGTPTRFFSFDLFNANLPYDLMTTGTGFRPRNAVTDVFNFAPYNYYQRPDERFTFGAFAHYEINKAADVYTQLMFMDDRTLAVIAPSGVFGATVQVPCDNPLLTAAQITTICTNAGLGPDDAATGLVFRRNVEGGGRASDLRHTDYRIVWGVRGDLGKGWNYDVYGQLSTVVFQSVYRNDFSNSRIAASLDIVRDPVTGQAICRNALPGANTPLTLAGCVPYDIFGAAGPSQAALAYLSTPAFSSGQTKEQVFSAQLTGNLGEYGLKSPMANDGIGVALGAEYRRESSEVFYDVASKSGDLAGFGAAPQDTAGAFDVMELFGEIRIPLVQDTPFFHDLTFEGGYRYSDYSLAGTTSTYKLALNWAPVPDIRFRGSYNRAVRAPNIVELFTPVGVGLGLNADPCSGPTPAFTQAQCANTGVTAAQYGRVPNNPANQYNALLGGNPNLSPETADSYSVGAVFTPTFFRGFSASVDYFNIKVDNTIGALNPDLILNNCAVTGAANLCTLIQRAAGNGSLFTGNSFVRGDNINIGGVRTAGVDFEVNYRLPMADWGMENVGGFDLAFQGTWLHELVTAPGLPALDAGGNVVATEFDCVGLYGAGFCATPSPKWRHRLRVTWTTPLDGLSVSVNWRYFGKVANQNFGSDNPYFDLTPIHEGDRELASQNYFDVAATWRVKENYTFRLGVNNVFDRDPPMVGQELGGTDSRFNGNTYPVVYDALGRFIFMGITADF